MRRNHALAGWDSMGVRRCNLEGVGLMVMAKKNRLNEARSLDCHSCWTPYFAKCATSM